MRDFIQKLLCFIGIHPAKLGLQDSNNPYSFKCLECQRKYQSYPHW